MRWHGYQINGKEQLVIEYFFPLSMLETALGGRKAAARGELFSCPPRQPKGLHHMQAEQTKKTHADDRHYVVIGKVMVGIVAVPIVILINLLAISFTTGKPFEVVVNEIPVIGSRLVSDETIGEKYGKPLDCTAGTVCTPNDEQETGIFTDEELQNFAENERRIQESSERIQQHFDETLSR